MAAGMMPPEFGGEFSPCAPGCGHRDCEALHRRAESACHYCLRPIGWEVRFYDVRGSEGDEPEEKDHSVHALCDDQAIEREQKPLRL